MFDKIIPRSEFTKNVLTVLAGTTLAQAVPLLISPILTRLFTPEDFGVFFLFTALLAVLSVGATAKYELAILLPEKDEDAVNILALVCLISLIASGALLVVILLFKDAIQNLLEDNSSGTWLYILPLSLLLAGVLQGFSYWSNRKKRFAELSASKVGQSSVTGTSNLAIGYSSASGVGLIFSTVLGQLTNIAVLVRSFMKNDRSVVACVNNKTMSEQAKRYGTFPKTMVLANIFNISAMQLPNILLLLMFGAQFLGLYALSQRVVKIPLTVMGNAYGEVFKQRAAEDAAQGKDLKPLLWRSLVSLALISLPFFVVFYLFAPSLFAFIFGDEWRLSGDYAKILTPYFYLAFVTAPLTHLFYILERTSIYLLIQGLLLCSILIGLYYAQSIGSAPETIVAVLSATYAVIYLVMIGVLTLSPGKK